MTAVAPKFVIEPQRVMAYCHDSVGVGHLRRTMAICERVGRHFPGTSFFLATGTPYVPLFKQIPGVDYLKLPALTKSPDGQYQSKFLNLSVPQVMRCRESLLLQTVRHYAPHVLLVDKAPLGVCRELVPALRWLRENRPETRVVFGMRDIEDDAEATIRQWDRDGVPQMLEECFSEIWVYGMPDVFDPVVQYRLPSALADKTRFMGYVSRGVCDHESQPAGDVPNVLVTVGGGTDGETLLDMYLSQAAQKFARMGVESTIIGGPDLPERAAERLRGLAEGMDSVEWIDFEPCMSCRIDRADLVVSMGGYNTLCEIVARRKQSLIIPRIRPRLEQAIRAELWEKRGLLTMLHPDQLSPATLAERAVGLLDRRQSHPNGQLDMDGLSRVVDRFSAFWPKEASHASSVRL